MTASILASSRALLDRYGPVAEQIVRTLRPATPTAPSTGDRNRPACRPEQWRPAFSSRNKAASDGPGGWVISGDIRFLQGPPCHLRTTLRLTARAGRRHAGRGAGHAVTVHGRGGPPRERRRGWRLPAHSHDVVLGLGQLVQAAAAGGPRAGHRRRRRVHDQAAPTLPIEAPPPASGPPTPLGGCGQALLGLDHSAEGPGARRFEVTQQQLAVIGSRLIEVFCRQGLWRQDVGFGVHYSKDRTRILVLVNPGRSGLTARQVLDRLLGRA
jgi:hypothetical protein